MNVLVGLRALDPDPAKGKGKGKGFENNWVQTGPGKHWFSYFRLYAPTEAYFDKSWKLDDITAVE